MAEPTTPMDPVIAALLRRRKEKGLRQQEVADSAGISRRALVSIEAGKDCTLSTLRSLCEALDLDLRTDAATGQVSPKQSASPGFLSAEKMSEYQADRELAEALRVRRMSPAEFSDWLTSTWGGLQRQANKMYANVPRPSVGQARHFKTLEEKNRFDEERETEFAVAVALARR